MATIPDADVPLLQSIPLRVLEVCFTPLYYGVKVTTSILSAITSFLYCLWTPPLRRSN
ncbi:uncharacterized protein [Drosophila bipectinata]|uniref:uncharacterized protein n=1 Tax=Drosophila bipectinata TaxID=42026 RepID=UPI001C890137|nr:uncharacterized protein LOC122322031 [Drosophila bipectinata]